MKARLLREMTCTPTPEFPSGVQPAGTLIDHPDRRAFRLVQMGVAEPVDDECRTRANRTPEQMAAAAHAYERTRLGIHPEDFEKFDAGEIVGYNADGSYIPGPVAAGPAPMDEEYEIEEDEYLEVIEDE